MADQPEDSAWNSLDLTLLPGINRRTVAVGQPSRETPEGAEEFGTPVQLPRLTTLLLDEEEEELLLGLEEAYAENVVVVPAP